MCFRPPEAGTGEIVQELLYDRRSEPDGTCPSAASRWAFRRFRAERSRGSFGPAAPKAPNAPAAPETAERVKRGGG